MTTTPHYIDAHCHLADPRFRDDLGQVLQRSERVGVRAWIQGGVCPEDWAAQRDLRRRYGARMILAFGVHPWWVAAHSTAEWEAALSTLETILSEAEGLGETGLDFGPRAGDESSRDRQTQAFESQLRLAKRERKPLILHIVRAEAEALSRLSREAPFPAGGMIHSFSGDEAAARRYLDLGFHLSVGGSVAREGFQKIKKAVVSLPPERLVVETDAPDQMPRGPGFPDVPRNEPGNLVPIAEVIGRLRGESAHAVLERSARNLETLFGLKHE